MTDVPPPGTPDHDPFGQTVQPPPPGLPGYPSQQWNPIYPPHNPGLPPHRDDAGSSRTKAVWALVLAILPLCVTWIAAAVLAIIVLAGPRDGQRRGRGMAWSALVIVALWVVGSIVAAVLVIASVPADRDDDGEVTSGGEVFAEDLQVGDCLAEDFGSDDEEVFTVSVLPCDEPHNGEVFHELELPAGDYPGDRTVAVDADEACYQEFDPWVGTPYEDSELDYFTYLPTQESWDYDDRLITCVVIAPDDVTGTLEGSNR